MIDEKVQQANPQDPTINVKNIVDEAVTRLDDLRKAEVKRIDDKIHDNDVKYQLQFTGSEKAVGTAFIAQEKAIAAALTGTKEAITKSDTNTDKRFDLLSEKIDGIVETMSKNSGAQGVYVTHSDLNIIVDKIQTNFETALRPVITFMNTQTGKEGVTDPMMKELLLEMKTVNTTLSNSGGQQKGMSSSWVILLGAAGFISTIVGIFMMLSRFLP